MVARREGGRKEEKEREAMCAERQRVQGERGRERGSEGGTGRSRVSTAGSSLKSMDLV